MMDSQLAVILVYGAIAFGLGAWNGFNSGERNGRIDVDRAKWIAADKVAQLQSDLKASQADCKRAEEKLETVNQEYQDMDASYEIIVKRVEGERGRLMELIYKFREAATDYLLNSGHTATCWSQDSAKRGITSPRCICGFSALESLIPPTKGDEK